MQWVVVHTSGQETGRPITLAGSEHLKGWSIDVDVFCANLR